MFPGASLKLLKSELKIILVHNLKLLIEFLSFQGGMILAMLFGLTFYIKRHKWSLLKSRKIIYTPKKYD